MSSIEDLKAAAAAQGEVVRKLKAEKADKAVITEAVNKLLALKKQQVEDAEKGGAPAAAPKQAPAKQEKKQESTPAAAKPAKQETAAPKQQAPAKQDNKHEATSDVDRLNQRTEQQEKRLAEVLAKLAAVEKAPTGGAAPSSSSGGLQATIEAKVREIEAKWKEEQAANAEVKKDYERAKTENEQLHYRINFLGRSIAEEKAKGSTPAAKEVKEAPSSKQGGATKPTEQHKPADKKQAKEQAKPAEKPKEQPKKEEPKPAEKPKQEQKPKEKEQPKPAEKPKETSKPAEKAKDTPKSAEKKADSKKVEAVAPIVAAAAAVKGSKKEEAPAKGSKKEEPVKKEEPKKKEQTVTAPAKKAGGEVKVAAPPVGKKDVTNFGKRRRGSP